MQSHCEMDEYVEVRIENGERTWEAPVLMSIRKRGKRIELIELSFSMTSNVQNYRGFSMRPKT